MSEFVTVAGLTIREGRNPVPLVREVSFSVAAGEAFTILGETGSGKSLVVKAIAGQLPPGVDVSGNIRVAGTGLIPPPANLRNVWGKLLFFVPQEASLALDPTARILSQVREVPEWGAPITAADAERVARDKLVAVDLDPSVDGRRYPCGMSGGMSQRTLVAMALASVAPLILLDEPTKNLDEARRDEVARLLRMLVESGKTVVTVSHDLALARELGGRVAIMRDGEIVETGPMAEVFAHPNDPYARRFLLAAPEPAEDFVPAGTEPCLDAEHLSFGFERKRPPLFEDLEVRVRPGEILGLFGPSGSGKTTLGDILLGLRRPATGRVLWGDVDAHRGPRRSRRALRDLYQKLYQDSVAAFAPHQTMVQAMGDVLSRRRAASKHQPTLQEVEEMARRLALRPDLFDRRPEELSGGETQRFAFLRVWMLRPRFVVADEPTSRLDPIVQMETVGLLRDLARRYSTGVLLISHDRTLIRAIANTAIELTRSPLT